MPTEDFGLCMYRTPTERKFGFPFLLCEKNRVPTRSVEQQGAKKVVQLTNSLFSHSQEKNQPISFNLFEQAVGEAKVEIKDSNGKLFTREKHSAVFVAIAWERKTKLTTKHCTWL